MDSPEHHDRRRWVRDSFILSLAAIAVAAAGALGTEVLQKEAHVPVGIIKTILFGDPFGQPPTP